MLKEYVRLANSGETQSFEWKLNRRDGSEFDAEIYLNVAQFNDEQYMLAVVRDITLRKEAEQKLIKQASYDTLTDLPNRSLAFDRLNLAVKQAQRSRRCVGVLFIDVDRFKSVNDTLGHTVGDQLIIEVGNRIKSCVREGDTVARLSGDEFLVIISSIRKVVDSEIVADKILQALNKPFTLEGQEFFLSASIGVTGYPNDGEEPQVLLRNADAAMYKAKENGRNNFQFYTPEINAQAQLRVKTETLLRRALTKDELFLTYQPQIDVRTHRLVGAEALIRWQSPELGLVRPDQFISLAEDTGLIVPIGEWVIHTACRQAKQWQEICGMPLRVSVNISQRQFRGSKLVNIVSSALDQTGLLPDALELEITESLLVDDDPIVLKAIKGLKDLGITLALDDFGTGYSSLSYLKRLPFDVLKIDRSFVRDITTDPDDATLCEAIMAIAASLDLVVVVEGVESKEQLEFLKFLGIHLAQGYYFSKPLNAEDFSTYIHHNMDKLAS